jgi:hypothetical protein
MSSYRCDTHVIEHEFNRLTFEHRTCDICSHPAKWEMLKRGQHITLNKCTLLDLDFLNVDDKFTICIKLIYDTRILYFRIDVPHKTIVNINDDFSDICDINNITDVLKSFPYLILGKCTKCGDIPTKLPHMLIHNIYEYDNTLFYVCQNNHVTCMSALNISCYVNTFAKNDARIESDVLYIGNVLKYNLNCRPDSHMHDDEYYAKCRKCNNHTNLKIRGTNDNLDIGVLRTIKFNDNDGLTMYRCSHCNTYTELCGNDTINKQQCINSV